MLPFGHKDFLKSLKRWFCSVMFMLNVSSGFILINNLFKGVNEKGTELGVLTDH